MRIHNALDWDIDLSDPRMTRTGRRRTRTTNPLARAPGAYQDTRTDSTGARSWAIADQVAPPSADPNT